MTPTPAQAGAYPQSTLQLSPVTAILPFPFPFPIPPLILSLSKDERPPIQPTPRKPAVTQ